MRERFPVLNESVYLNTAYVGLASVELMEFRASFDRNYIHQGDQFKIKGYERLASQRETLATFLGSHPCCQCVSSCEGTNAGLRYIPPVQNFSCRQETDPSTRRGKAPWLSYDNAMGSPRDYRKN